MRTFILEFLDVAAATFVLQAASSPAHAGVFDECSPCAEIADCNPCDDAADCGKKNKFFLNGFIESGLWANEYGNTNEYWEYDITPHNTYSYPGNAPALQNVQHTGYQVNQTYISAGKSVDGKYGWDFGGTADFVFGTDAWMVQSKGFEKQNGHHYWGWGTGDYYAAFSQAYFEAAYKKLNIKAGKFYAPFGAQGFRGDNNFFYSFAPNWNFVPATTSGAYGTYAVNSKLSVVGGWVVPDMFGETSHNNAFLGGAVYQPTKKLNLAYFAAAGQIGKEYMFNVVWRGMDIDYFVNSLVGTYQINKKWKAVIDWTLFNTQIDRTNYNNTAWGVNTALYYQYTKKLAFGVRYNYVSGSNYTNFGADYGRYGINGSHSYGSFYGSGGVRVQDWAAISLGANWTPTKWLVVKPEVRWDIIGGSGYFQNGIISDGDYITQIMSTQQFSGGLSTVVKF